MVTEEATDSQLQQHDIEQRQRKRPGAVFSKRQHTASFQSENYLQHINQ